MTAEKLSVELKKLDRQVTIAIVDQTSTMFSDVERPIHQLLAAATAPVPVSMHLNDYMPVLNCSIRSLCV
jgi:hypothetical protein